jgi:hypothetical protein
VVGSVRRISSIFKEFIEFLQGIHRATIESSVSSLELECAELEFALLTMLLGSLVGIIPMPTSLTLELLPYLKDELRLLESRSVRGSDVLSDLMSSLGGEW